MTRVSNKNLDKVYEWAVENQDKDEIAEAYLNLCHGAYFLNEMHKKLFGIVERAYPNKGNVWHWHITLDVEKKYYNPIQPYRDAIAHKILKIIANENKEDNVLLNLMHETDKTDNPSVPLDEVKKMLNEMIGDE